jgi:hypothetical protein
MSVKRVSAWLYRFIQRFKRELAVDKDSHGGRLRIRMSYLEVERTGSSSLLNVLAGCDLVET